MKISEVKPGMKFGSLTVTKTYVKVYKRTKNNWPSYLNYCVCDCDCGSRDITILTATLIRKMEKSSCGHCHQVKLIGKQFKHLTVIGLPINGSVREVRTKCNVCGNQTNSLISDLESGNVRCYNCKSELAGYKFGRLEYIKLLDERIGRDIVALTRCDCGNNHKVTLTSLVNGHITSCGKCYNGIPLSYKEDIHDRCVKLSKIYKGIKRRCENPFSSEFHSYGGRGIELNIDKTDFIMMFCYNKCVDNESSQLDRIDNDGNYTATNLRIIPNVYNTNNRLYNYSMSYDKIASRLMTKNVIRGVKSLNGDVVNLSEFYTLNFGLKTTEGCDLHLYVHYTLRDKLDHYKQRILNFYKKFGRDLKINNDFDKPLIYKFVSDMSDFVRLNNLIISSFDMFKSSYYVMKSDYPEYDNISIISAYELYKVGISTLL